jgi:predicted dehydrogenase
MTGNKKIRGAVIGYGGAFNMGKTHARQMQEVGFDFVAACDLSADRMAEAEKDFPDIRTYTSVDALLAQDDIDLITVITPHNTHYTLAKQILESGKHCILEKPMCITVEEADTLLRISREKGLMLTVYHNRRWDGWIVTLKDLINKGIMGDIFHIEMHMGRFGKPKDWWRSNKEVSGGTFYDWGAHLIDYTLEAIPGKIRGVRGVIHNNVWHGYSNEDQVDSLIYFENNTFAHITISAISRIPKQQFRVLGTKGAVEGSLGGLKLYTDEHPDGKEIEFVKRDKPSYYQNIADHLYKGEELIVKPEEARRIIAIIETTEKSAKEGKELIVPYEEEIVTP